MKQKNKLQKDEFQKILDKTYRFLAIRPRSKKEISDYLKKKKIPNPFVKEIFKILEEQNLVNDKEFASWWIEQRTIFRPKGKVALKVELKQKGIAPEIIEKEVEKIDELSLAEKALQKKLKIYGKLPPTQLYQKISTFLSYRGFSWQTIKEILSSCEKFF